MPDSPDDAPGGADMQARFEKLSSALDARRANQAKAKPLGGQGNFAEAGRGMNLGFRMVAEMIGGVVVGMAIGWELDRLFATKPVLMILFLFLGMAAGVLNVMRAAASLNSTGNNERGS